MKNGETETSKSTETTGEQEIKEGSGGGFFRVFLAVSLVLFALSLIYYISVYFIPGTVSVMEVRPAPSPAFSESPSPHETTASYITPTPVPAFSPTPSPTTSPPRFQVNINICGKEMLMKLPHVGSKRADWILEYRKKHGPFQKPEDIMSVPGIGRKTFEKIKNNVIVK